MNKYVELAKCTVEFFVKNNKKLIVPKDLPKNFYTDKAGVFVTIYKDKKLRGCIGTIYPAKNNIAEEIIENSISACSRDPRFDSVEESELEKIDYEISILSSPYLFDKKHDPKKHGLIVSCNNGRSGLLLPNLEGIETTEKQINIACQKAGIDTKNKDISLYSFTVERYK